MSINVLSLKEIREYLEDKKIGVVSARSGLSYASVRNLFVGAKQNYTLETLEKISKYIIETETNKKQYKRGTEI